MSTIKVGLGAAAAFNSTVGRGRQNAAAGTANAQAANQQQQSNATLSDEEISAIQNETTRLKQEVERLKRKINETETEKAAFQYQLSEVQKRSKEQQEKLISQLNEAKDSIHRQEEKISRIDVVEEEIIKLYLEFKDRSTDVVQKGYEQNKAEQVEREKEALRREKPLVIIDRLKANLRILWAFKDEYENELKSQMNRRKSDTEKELQELRKVLENLERENEDHKQSAIRAIQMRDEAIAAKREIIMESNNIINKMKADNLKMKDILTEKEKEIDQLNETLDKRDKILRHRETQLMRVQQLQKEKANMHSIHQMNMSKMRSDQNKLRRDYEKLCIVNSSLKAEKERNEDVLKKLENDLRSYRMDANQSLAVKLKKDVEQQDRQIKTLENELEQAQQLASDMKEEARKLRVSNQDLVAKNEKMKEEYRVIFELHLKHQQARMAQMQQDKVSQMRKSMSGEREDKRSERDNDNAINQDIAERNTNQQEGSAPHLLNYYKSKLAEKEREVAELTKRVRRMILAEHRGHIQEKNFELERSRLINELTSLRRSNPDETNTPFLKSKDLTEEELRGEVSTLHEKLRDYNNLENMFKNTSAAYGQLLASTGAASKNDQANGGNIAASILKAQQQQQAEGQNSDYGLQHDLEAEYGLSSSVQSTPRLGNPRPAELSSPASPIAPPDQDTGPRYARHASSSSSFSQPGKRPLSATSVPAEAMRRPLSASRNRPSSARIGSARVNMSVGTLSNV